MDILIGSFSLFSTESVNQIDSTKDNMRSILICSKLFKPHKLGICRVLICQIIHRYIFRSYCKFPNSNARMIQNNVKISNFVGNQI